MLAESDCVWGCRVESHQRVAGKKSRLVCSGVSQTGQKPKHLVMEASKDLLVEHSAASHQLL